MKYQVALLLTAFLPVAARAQYPPPAPFPAPGHHYTLPGPLPLKGPAPLLYVRFTGPAGLKVTFFDGSPAGRTFAAPVAAGLRPGYVYRVRLTGFPEFPGLSLYPTLEVRGSLHLPPRLKAADYPAPVVLGADEVQRAVSETLITKVIFVEDPERAVAEATNPDQPIELNLAPGRDPLVEARERGRPMVILRLGGREYSDEELARQGVPGTILLPGDTVLGPPACGPWVPWACVPVGDPLRNTRHPEEECLYDGGDAGLPAGLDPEGRLRGLDPADTVAEYTDVCGRRRLTVSNRVCICVPRFVITRVDVGLASHAALVGPLATEAVKVQNQVRKVVPSLQAVQAKEMLHVNALLKPSGTLLALPPVPVVGVALLKAYDVPMGLGALLGTKALDVLTKEQRVRLARQIELARELSQPIGPQEVEQVKPGPRVVARIEGPNILTTVQEVRDLTVTCEAPVPPDKPLVLHKWSDRLSAQVGDVVTFFLKYSNHGGQPITDVVVSDSLTGRLEYIPGSAKSDREAVFTNVGNEAGSVILRWEVHGRILPGQSGVVSFQARVR
jgi:uncharacterized repeat protein (TIGR01451 family)